MSNLAWLALAGSFVAVSAGIAFAVVRAVAAWRTFRSFRRLLGPQLDDVLRQAETAEGRLAGAGEKAAMLEGATARLRASLSTAAVLMAAARETRDRMRALRDIPRA
jgi:hypothetical protein